MGISIFLPHSKRSSIPEILDVTNCSFFAKRFVIEVGLPYASLDLELTVPLERLVISVLEEDIGIGRYPNDARRVGDVAALAVHVAMTARAAGDSLTKSE